MISLCNDILIQYCFIACLYHSWVTLDTCLKLLDSSGVEVGYNDDSVECNLGSKISYVVPSTVVCQQYFLREGCSTNNTCSGTAGVVFLDRLPTSGICQQ